MPSSEKTKATCRPRFRIMAGKEIALGPGKVDLLEAIIDTGSISAAAREIGLSYRRAWAMVHTMNACFKEPLVESSKGGKGGGGAKVTPTGKSVAALYRSMESKTRKSTQAEWKSIQKFL